MTEIDISKPESEGGWGIVEGEDKALQNTCAFLRNFEDLDGSDEPAKLHLPAGTYEFNTIFFNKQDNIQFHGDTDASGEPITVIKFKAFLGGKGKWCEDQGSNKEWHRGHTHLEIVNADNFNIHDLAFDGRDAFHEGGVWAKDGATNGTIKNVKVYDPKRQGITIGGNDYESTPKTYNITVEDCEVYGQREWSGYAKASFLAGGGADDVTFENCTAYRCGFYDSTPDSPADLFDTDDATNVKYINCTAEGTDNETIRKGTGFWNEGEHEASSEYWDCEAKKTGGGLGASEQSTAVAHNFYFDDCSWGGWAARARCCSDLQIYDSTFDNCSSSGPFRKGGVVAESNIVVDNCEFINTPEFNEDESTNFNICFYTPDEQNDPYTMNIKNNTFDRGVTSFNDSSNDAEVTVYVQNNLFQHEAALNQYGPNYTWNVSGNTWGPVQESATTTAVNTPTSSNTIGVEYEYHTTSVQYSGGESLDGVILKMRKAINTDAGAEIIADINTGDNTITFTQKDAGSSGNYVNIVNVDISDWGNDSPFNPMSPSMS